MQIREALKYEASQVDILDRECILAHTLKKAREYIIAHGDAKIPYTKYLLYRWQLRKRKNNVPLAYITGYKDFFGYKFLVNKHTLVPRPDTELLVEKTIELTKKEYEQEQAGVVVIDIGTGSGCIPISISKSIDTNSTNKKIAYFASDISAKALRIAKKNAVLLRAPIKFKKGNLLEPYNFENYKNDTVIITANLPYLTQEQFEEEKSIQREPHRALVALENGLTLYRQLLEQLVKKTRTTTALEPRSGVQGGDNRAGQEKIILLCEIDPNQTIEFKKIVKHYLPDAQVEIKKDLANLDRLAIVQF